MGGTAVRAGHNRRGQAVCEGVRVDRRTLHHHRRCDPRVLHVVHNGALLVVAVAHHTCVWVPVLTQVVVGDHIPTVASSAHTVLIVVFLSWDGGDDLELAAKDHGEAVPAEGLFDAGDAGTVAPFVELAPECISLKLEKAEFAGREDAVTAGSVNVCDRGVDDRGFRWAPNLGEIRQEGSEVLGNANLKRMQKVTLK